MTQVIVSGGFDRLTSADFRLLHEASRLGELQVLLWPDRLVQAITGRSPRFPLAERRYVIESVRYVTRIEVADPTLPVDTLPLPSRSWPDIWVVDESGNTAGRQTFCAAHGLTLQVLAAADLAGFPAPPATAPSPGRKKVVVTGCYDVFHSGHVRFFEEASTYGELFVVVGNDANVRELKGAGHPLVPENERRYLVGSIRHVTAALISSGTGWMDAAPEIKRIEPDIYLVNEDGDRPEKRAFCRDHGLEYVVCQRLPKTGLTRRSSTDLRGF